MATFDLRRAALYLGGLLGPFGGGVTAPVLPDIAGSFDITLTTAGLALTTYFIPFAVVQLVSGTVGERWGRRRTTRIAFAGYAVASVLCAAAPDAGVFFAGRVLQGVANAFTTPLLLAGLAEVVAPAALSRTVGLFGAFQALGQTAAPLVGALSVAVPGPLSWRLAFVVVAAVGIALAFLPPEGDARPGVAAPRFRELATGRMALTSLASFASYAGGAGLPFLVALYAERRFAVSDAAVGFVILGFGAAGIVLSALWGAVSDRIGAPRTAVVGLAGCALLVAALPHTGSVGWLVVAWTAAGAMGALATVGIQSVAAREIPGNRGGAVSVVSAFRFFGGALAPLVLLPLYPSAAHGAGLAFLVAGAVALAGAGCAAGLTTRRPQAPTRR